MGFNSAFKGLNLQVNVRVNIDLRFLVVSLKYEVKGQECDTQGHVVFVLRNKQSLDCFFLKMGAPRSFVKQETTHPRTSAISEKASAFSI